MLGCSGYLLYDLRLHKLCLTVNRKAGYLMLPAQLKSRQVKGTSGGTAFQFGACKDSQVAADTNGLSGSAYTGAATFSFIEAIERYGAQQTYARWVAEFADLWGMPVLPAGPSSFS